MSVTVNADVVVAGIRRKYEAIEFGTFVSATTVEDVANFAVDYILTDIIGLLPIVDRDMLEVQITATLKNYDLKQKIGEIVAKEKTAQFQLDSNLTALFKTLTEVCAQCRQAILVGMIHCLKCGSKTPSLKAYSEQHAEKQKKSENSATAPHSEASSFLSALVKKESQSSQANQKFFTFTTSKKTGSLKWVVIKSSTLNNYLRALPQMRNVSLFNNPGNNVSAEQLYRAFGSLWQKESPDCGDEEGDNMIRSFLDALRPHYCKRLERVNQFLAKGQIFYDDLWYLYPTGTEIVFTVRDSKFGGTVKSTGYEGGFYPRFYVDLHYVQSDGLKFFHRKKQASVFPFGGALDISDLPVRLIKAEEKAKLAQRGHLFQELATKASHWKYEGYMYNESWMGMKLTHVRGRIMVDVATFIEQDSNHSEFNRRNRGDDDNNNNERNRIDESHLWMAWPTLPAFDLQNKKWGEIRIDLLNPIDFCVEAFNQLGNALSTNFFHCFFFQPFFFVQFCPTEQRKCFALACTAKCAKKLARLWTSSLAKEMEPLFCCMVRPVSEKPAALKQLPKSSRRLCIPLPWENWALIPSFWKQT